MSVLPPHGSWRSKGTVTVVTDEASEAAHQHPPGNPPPALPRASLSPSQPPVPPTDPAPPAGPARQPSWAEVERAMTPPPGSEGPGAASTIGLVVLIAIGLALVALIAQFAGLLN